MNRFLVSSPMNHTSESSKSPILNYKAALLQVLQKNGSKMFEIDFRPESFTFHANSRPSTTSDGKQNRNPAMTHAEEYTDEEGELDMLIGYFMMNFVCIVFFLMFGMCVMCSCMRKKPAFLKSKERKKNYANRSVFTFNRSTTPKTSMIAPLSITTPGLKPTFKAIVSKAVASEKIEKLVTNGSVKMMQDIETGKYSEIELNNAEKMKLLRRSSECPQNFQKLETQVEKEPIRCQSVTSNIHIKTNKPSKSPVSTPVFESAASISKGTLEIPITPCRSHQLKNESNLGDFNCQKEETSSNSSEESDEQPSVVRQNLLGPLTFDDLYYT